MIGYLSDDQHERLWRLCDALVSGAGARAAMVCDASNGTVIVSVGDATARGAVSSVETLGPGERVVHGEGGHVYGVDVPGGALLAVLHDDGALEKIRAAAAEAVAQTAALLMEVPPPLPEPEPHAQHSHVSADPTEAVAVVDRPAPARKAQPRKKAATKRAQKTRKPATKPARKAAKPSRKAPKKSARKKPPARKPKRAARPKPRRRR